MSSLTRTKSATYTSTDIAAVFRRFEADILMIAQSSGAITEARAREYAHDVGLLADRGFLTAVDVTLFSGGESGREIRAARYTVDDNAGGLATSRPGGVLWPRVDDPYLRLVLTYTAAYTQTEKLRLRSALKRSWSPTSADTRHLTLNAYASREYSSNGYGLRRNDFQ